MSAKIKYIFSLLLLFNISLVLYYFNQRNIFHTDEQWSYGHANSTQGAFLSPTIDSFFNDVNNDISYKWIDGKVFHNYLTVQENEQFRYGHIGENLKKDVHPPLFYVLLHTVCSFFPEVFSKWQGGVINILFFALTLIMLFKLSRLVLQDDILALMPVFLWGFSNIGIGTAVYIRMYMMQTFFAVGLVYETLLLLRENKVNIKRLGMVYLYSSLGILAQYNSLIFSFFVAVAGGMVLLCRKKWRLLFAFGACMFLSVVTLFVLFPDAYEVLLHSQQGEATGGRLKVLGCFWSLMLKINSIWEVYVTQLFSFRTANEYILAIFFILGFTAICNQQKNMEIRMLCFICVCISLLVALFMPVMYIFWSRYFMSVMPFAAILTVYLIVQGGIYLALSKRVMILLLSLIIAINSLWADFSKRSAYSFKVDEENVILLDKIRHKRLIIVSPMGVWGFFSGGYLYKDGGETFGMRDICENVEERAQADYLLVYNSKVKSMDGHLKKRLFDERCMKNLEFLSVAKLSADLMFDVYKIVK